MVLGSCGGHCGGHSAAGVGWWEATAAGTQRQAWAGGRPLQRALSGRRGLVGSCSRHCQHTLTQKHVWVPSLGWTRPGPECTTFPSPVGALALCHSALIRDGQILGKVRPRAVRLPDSGTATEAPVAAAQHEVWDEHAGERDAASGCLGGTGDAARVAQILTDHVGLAGFSAHLLWGRACSQGYPLPVSDLDTQPHPLSRR